MSAPRSGGLFVGRDGELEAHRALIDSVVDQSGAIALVGFCFQDGGAPPYWPWIQAIRGYIEIHDAMMN